MLKRTLGKALPYALKQHVRLAVAELQGAAPIAIYQMGKVGSTTVEATLRAPHIKHTIYNVHFMTRSGLARADTYYARANAEADLHVQAGRVLQQRLDRRRGPPRPPWKIITLARDPIDRDISGFFQNMHLDAPGKTFTEAEMLARLRTHFAEYDEATDFACTWFDQELRARFGADVFSAPFDAARGYQIIKTPAADILVLRLEDLRQVLPVALRDFLGTDRPFEIVSANVGDDKAYKDLYRKVKTKLDLSLDTVASVYQTRYARHFYHDRIDDLIAKWARA